jgi:hypothetical protein
MLLQLGIQLILGLKILLCSSQLRLQLCDFSLIFIPQLLPALSAMVVAGPGRRLFA